MSFVQRAWLYITRKKLKTLILLAILLCMSTIMLSGFAIKHSTDAAAQSLDKTLKAGFTLGNNPRTIREQPAVRERCRIKTSTR